MQESVSYARIADRYEQVRGGDARAEQLVASLLPWIRSGLLCDVGAGTGIVSDHLRRAGASVVACDLSIEMIAQASDRLPGRIQVADATALPLRDESVDTVAFVWVLHHVGDLAAALHEAKRVLRPGGRLVSISGLSDSADDDMAPIFERLNDSLRPERRPRSLAVAGAGRAIGFDVVHEGTATMDAAVSPAELVESVEQRLFAPLWDLPDDVWRRVVQPAVDELLALPNPDRPRHRVFDHPLVVLGKPES